jgi:hypothetical protein
MIYKFVSISRLSVHRTAVVVFGVILYTTVDLFVNTVIVDAFLFLDIGTGVALLLGILFGFPAAAAVASGTLLSDALGATLGLETVVSAMSLFLFASLSALLHEQMACVDPNWSNHRTWVYLASAVGIATIVSSSFLAWSHELLGVSPFFTSFAVTVARYAAVGIVVLPVVILLVKYRPVPVISTDRYVPDTKVVVSQTAVGLALSWPVLATVGSVGFRIRERITAPFAFREIGIEWVYFVIHPDIFGYGGRRAQVVFGALMIITLGYVAIRPFQGEESAWS